ncbi:MAG: SUMF1/EgtB/PvdO family nonheme iron enzyme [Bacteroidales bacterium]
MNKIALIRLMPVFFILVFMSSCRNEAPLILVDKQEDTIQVNHGDEFSLKISFVDDRDELNNAAVLFNGEERYSGADSVYIFSHATGNMRAGVYTMGISDMDADSLEATKEIMLRVKGVKPVIAELKAGNTRATSAMFTMPVLSDGGMKITEKGILWSTEGEPGINGNRLIIQDKGPEYLVDGFPRNSKLFVRGYVIHGAGVTMTQSVEIKTMSGIPAVSTGKISEIHSRSVSGSGRLLTDGGADINRYGIVYSKEPIPTTGDEISKAAGKSSFIVKLSDLTPFTKYYFRAFATNRFATVYGDEGSFETTGPPTVITGNPGRILVNGINMTIDVTFNGGHPVTEAGVVYSQLRSPTIDNNVAVMGKGTGKISGLVSGLEPGSSYHLRAYAKNSEGVSYGEELVLFTKIGIPTVSTTTVTDVDISSATVKGIVSDDGGLDVIEQGFAWDTIPNPTKSGGHFAEVNTESPELSYSIKGLETGTKYFVRAYARNEKGYVYADAKSFIPLIPVEMIKVKGGTFNMGSESGNETEMPVHTVTLSPFSMSAREVTNTEFARFLNANISRITFEGNGEVVLFDGIPVYYLKVYGDDYDKSGFRVHIAYSDGKFRVNSECDGFPAILVSWEGAKAFCRWAGGRLPTEAEWEYAAREGGYASTYSGGDNIDLLGWYYRNSRNADCELTGDSRGIFKTGQKRPNSLGFYDLTGNAAEWCSDIYQADYYKNSPEVNPAGPEKGLYRVIRGGSWADREELCTVYSRIKSFDITRGYDNIAFRLVRPVE